MDTSTKGNLVRRHCGHGVNLSIDRYSSSDDKENVSQHRLHLIFKSSDSLKGHAEPSVLDTVISYGFMISYCEIIAMAEALVGVKSVRPATYYDNYF